MKRAMKILIVICLALALLAGMSSGIAAATAESVWVNGMELIDGDYFESQDATEVKTGATTQPTMYTAWYYDGTLWLHHINVVNGHTFSISGENVECGICADGDLVINLTGSATVDKADGLFFPELL